MRNMRQKIYLSVIAVILLSCDEVKNDSTNKADVKEETVEALNTAANYTEEEKKELMELFETKKDQTKVQIDEFKKKMATIKKSQKKALEKTVQKLENEQKNLEKNLEDLKNASDSAYDHVRIGVDSIIVELDQAIQLARKEFE